MAALDMATITKYLERSMQNCSLSNRRKSVGDGFGMTDESDDHIPISDTTLELNSHISIPSHLEQCLDLKVKELDSSVFFFFLFGLATYSLQKLRICVSGIALIAE